MATHHMLASTPDCYSQDGALISPADCASRGPGAFYAVATASGDVSTRADVPFPPLGREGGDSIPAPIQSFLATWIAAPVRVPVSRDFTFKAVIGEPAW